MKNTDTNNKDGSEFRQVQSARSPGEQPMSDDKEIITKREIRFRLIVTVVIILAIFIGLLIALL